jgi:hypothetical protein
MLEMFDSAETGDRNEQWKLWNQKLWRNLPDHCGKSEKDELLSLELILFTSRKQSALKRAKGTKLRGNLCSLSLKFVSEADVFHRISSTTKHQKRQKYHSMVANVSQQHSPTT